LKIASPLVFAEFVAKIKFLLPEKRDVMSAPFAIGSLLWVLILKNSNEQQSTFCVFSGEDVNPVERTIRAEKIGV
jgi:hypothetical protein